MTLLEKIQDLENYAKLDGTEWGDAAELLCCMYRYKYCFSADLNLQIENEIDNMLTYAKENATVKQKTVTYTNTTEYLEWNNQ